MLNSNNLVILFISIGVMASSDTIILEKTYWKSKQIKEKRREVNNKLEGIKEEYFQTGNQKAISNYSRGKLDGLSLLWNEDGILTDSVIYKSNVEIEHFAYYQTGHKKYYILNNQFNKTEEAIFYTKSGAVVGSVDNGNGFFISLSEKEQVDKVLIVKNGECISSAPMIDFMHFALFVGFQVAYCDTELYSIKNSRLNIASKIKKGYIRFEQGTGISEESALLMNGEINSIEDCVLAEYCYIDDLYGEMNNKWKISNTRLITNNDRQIDEITISFLSDSSKKTIYFNIFGLFHKNY